MKHIEKIENTFYQDWSDFWQKESQHCEQKHLTADTISIIKDFLRSSHTSFIQDLIQRVEGGKKMSKTQVSYETGIAIQEHDVSKAIYRVGNELSDEHNSALDTIISLLKEEI
jgi:hypothetical protein